MIGVNADFSANAGSHDRIVAREHLDLHAVFAQRQNGLACALFGRIEESENAFDRETALIVVDERRLSMVGQAFSRNDQHTESLLIEGLRLFEEPLGALWREGHQRGALLQVRADAEHFFHRAFADQAALFGSGIFNEHRYTAADKVKRQLVELHKALAHGSIQMRFAAAKNSLIDQIFGAALAAAVKPGIGEHGRTFFALRIQIMLEDDLVLSERSGFIRAEDVHCAKVLNGIQALDDHFAPAHGNSPFGQIGAHDHGQHFRRQPDRNSQCEE